MNARDEMASRFAVAFLQCYSAKYFSFLGNLFGSKSEEYLQAIPEMSYELADDMIAYAETHPAPEKA